MEQQTGDGNTWAAARDRLLLELQRQGITSKPVLAAMAQVPRHRFVPQEHQQRSYENVPLSIGMEQTISQPFIVALMSELAEVTPADRVLVVGTGSGYQDAVLARLVKEVHSIERIVPLAETAIARLQTLGYNNVYVHVGDGYQGLPEKAPFAAIVVTAAAPQVPNALLEQLQIGGRLVIPVGESQQHLRVLVRAAKGVQDVGVVPVQFVPLVRGAPRPVV